MDIAQIESLVSDCIRVDRHQTTLRYLLFYGMLLRESKEAFETIKDRLRPLGLVPFLKSNGEEVELKIASLRETARSRPVINIVLLLVTILTTTIAGSILAQGNLPRSLSDLLIGIPFSFTLLLILGSHELGHYFACKRLGIAATLPFFIPVPPPFILGTFGAVIRIKSPIEDKRGLIEVGAAGPLIGFIIAIPVTIIGLRMSTLVPATDVAGQAGIFALGESLLFSLFTKAFVQIPQGDYTLLLHPVAFSGWVGLFVTALNLLPVSQLDGGHISYALFGRLHRRIGLGTIGILAMLGIIGVLDPRIGWVGFLIWTIFIGLIIGVRHPPPLDDVTPLDMKHKIIGWTCIMVFVLTFVPVPFRIII
jgi:membrane-associated protease RseP (regulator of RpoE activity)